MDELHSLLRRQVRRYKGESTPPSQWNDDFLRAINDAYLQFDADRRMLEHSLELTSQELLERNAELTRINSELEQRVQERTASLQSTLDYMYSLFQVTQSVVAFEDLQDVLKSIVDSVADTISADRATVITFNHEEQRITNLVAAGKGAHNIETSITYAELMEGLSGWVVREARPAFSPKGEPDLRESPAAQERRLATNSGCVVVLPLSYMGEIQGTMTVINRLDQPDFTKQEVAWMEAIAIQASTAIGRAQVYDQLRKANSLLEKQSERLQRELADRQLAEAALAVERDLLQALMDNVPDTIYFKDAASRFTRINQAQVKVLGLSSPEQAIGKSDMDFQPTELSRGFYEEEQQIIQTGVPLINRVEFNPTKTGQPRWFSATKVPVRNPQGQVIGLVGISRDITELRAAEAALEQSEALFRALFDLSPDAVLVIDPHDPDGRWPIIDCNIAACSMNGYERDELVGQSIDILNLTSGTEAERSTYLRNLRESNYVKIETSHRRKNGVVFPVEVSTALITVGTRELIIGIDRDITARKQAEEDLRQSEERFRLMAWATRDAVWDWDLRAGQIWWGAGLQKMFQYPSEALQTNPEWWRDRIHENDKAKVDRTLQQALDGGMEFWSKEYRFRRLDGTYANIMDRAYILRDDAGQPIRMLGAMMDITERKQFEEVIQSQNEMLSSLYEITLDLLKYRDVNSLLSAMVDLSAKFLDANFAEIMLLEREALVVRAVSKNQSHLIGRRMGRRDAVLSWRAFDTRQHVVLDDYNTWASRGDVYSEHVLHAVAVYPILNESECLGVLGFGRDKPGYEFTADQIKFGGLLANLTALILNNAQLREALREQSIHDPLTGLFNRRYMEEAFIQQLGRATREQQPLSMLMVDIDHFKLFNDSHGHAAGDVLLQAVGRFLKNNIRIEDIACRYGGEEFLLILPGASLQETEWRAERLRREIKELQVEHDGKQVGDISLSVGVAAYPEHGSSPESIMRAADAALYRAKQAGRDRVIVA